MTYNKYRDWLSDINLAYSIDPLYGTGLKCVSSVYIYACLSPILQVALLSGPPGLGKTTLAHIIARHAGYNVVEINARSDCLHSYPHSSRLLRRPVSLPCRSPWWSLCYCFCSDDRSAELFQKRIDTATQMQSVLGANQKPNCLIIDEIDGAPAVRTRPLSPAHHLIGCRINLGFSLAIRLPNSWVTSVFMFTSWNTWLMEWVICDYESLGV